jgi:hypothetical protein
MNFFLVARETIRHFNYLSLRYFSYKFICIYRKRQDKHNIFIGSHNGDKARDRNRSCTTNTRRKHTSILY